jgi:hypothetical protein
MMNKTLYEGKTPFTQSAEAVKQLIAYQTYGREPAEMPPFYRLGCEMVLVQSNKKDVYYVTTPEVCSCPAATYHPGPCKHSRKYFPQQKTEAIDTPAEGAKRLARPPKDSIRPEGKWPGGFNGPVDEIKAVA